MIIKEVLQFHAYVNKLKITDRLQMMLKFLLSFFLGLGESLFISEGYFLIERNYFEKNIISGLKYF
jgi:dimeric dUTPase (all-alpha-NTP-PPase superfamily)